MKLQEILTINEHWNSPMNGGFGTDKNTCHSYVSNFYEDEFVKYREKSISLLEIGIARGDSLLLWDKYFVNNTMIFGLDNYDLMSEEVRSNSKIKKLFVDAYDKNVSDILPSFDIIIDDGPHSLESQQKAIQLYLPKVNPGGMFIIEDIQEESHIDILINSLSDKFKNYCRFIDLRLVKNRKDDMMFVVDVPG